MAKIFSQSLNYFLAQLHLEHAQSLPCAQHSAPEQQLLSWQHLLAAHSHLLQEQQVPAEQQVPEEQHFFSLQQAVALKKKTMLQFLLYQLLFARLTRHV